jgi:transcriptional regulator with XRE-family HTH domain
MADKKSWDERFDAIVGEFPNIENFNWGTAVSGDMDLFTDLLHDVIKTSRPGGGKQGKRPKLSRLEASERLDQLAGEDFTELCFADAFAALKGARSIRHTASKCEIDRNIVYDLLKGKKQPTFKLMEQIATSFGKDPSYFLEYRVGYVTSKLNTFLYNSPDTATLWFKNFHREFIKVK